MRPHILLVDGDLELHPVVAQALETHQLQLTAVLDGSAALEEVKRHPVEGVLLAEKLPDQSGASVLRALRQVSEAPVVMLTEPGNVAAGIEALELGAEDFVEKPLSWPVLVARLRAAMRRRPSVGQLQSLSASDILLDVPGRRATRGGVPLDLTGAEFNVLLVLLRHAGEVVERETILSEAGRGEAPVSDRTVDVHISRLRRKLGDGRRRGRHILTIRGVGYVLTTAAP